MNRCRAALGLLLIICCLAPVMSLQAAEPVMTTIYVKDLHCPTCAKRVSGRLYTVAGVVEVTTDVKAKTAVVKPQANKTPSPRAMWDAVIKSGFQPVKLVGPTGTFTSRPSS